jgi:hypothetical protein
MSTLGKAGSEIARALRRLRVPVASIDGRTELLSALGWTLPPGVNDVAIGAIDLADVLEKFDTLNRSSDAEENETLLMLERDAQLALAIGKFVQSLATLSAQVFNGLPADWLAATNIKAEFPKRLLDLVVLQYVESVSVPLFNLLKLAGIFVVTDVEADPAQFRSQHRHLELVLDRAGAIVSPSRDWAKEVYGWGTPQYDAALLVTNLRDMFTALGGAANLGTMARVMEEAIEGRPVPEADTNPMPLAGAQLFRSLLPDTAAGGLAVFGVRPSSPGGSDGGLGFTPFLVGTTEFSFPLYFSTDSWDLVFKIEGASVSGGLAAFVRAGSPMVLRQNLLGQSGALLQSGRIGAGIRFRPASGKINLLDLGDDSGFSVSEVELLVGGRAAGGSVEGFGELTLTGGLLTIGTGSADGFLTSLLGGKPLAIELDASVEFTQSGGLRFKGGAVLDVALAVQLDLGVVVIRNIHLRIGLSGEGLELETSAGIVGKFGPVTALVERVGLATDLKFQNGNVGPADLSLAFKPPSGVGIEVDAGAVRGGGFLYFDFAAGRYSGALELSVYAISVKAFGIIDTKLPDGSDGFSFVIVISAEFTPIQLGFGFTLLGVGGMLGINRSLNAEGLQSVVRSGSLDNILFPTDVAANAPAIINDLATIFPAAPGHYVFGPMAKLGWGTPTLIDAELGIILELPGPRLALLGVVNMALPTKEAALLSIHLAVAGLLDFPKKLLAIDASLYDSQVVGFPIRGDMAFRLAFGDEPNFALSVGGLHPTYQPPPGFPELSRVSIELGINGNPSLTASGYFALTSNTAQVGAALDLRASGAGIHLTGHLGFDALFVFSPFSFEASFSAGVRVSFHGAGFGIGLHGSIKGPTPWHVSARACVSVLFWDACLPVDISFGTNQRAELPPMDPWLGDSSSGDASNGVEGLQSAMGRAANWSGSFPKGAHPVVTLTEQASLAGTPIDPIGQATLRQKVLPLNFELTRFGIYKPVAHTHFKISSVIVGTATLSSPPAIKDKFAPALFKDMSDAEKIASQPYQSLDAGFTIDPDNVVFGEVPSHTITYDTEVIDDLGNSTLFLLSYALTDRHVTAMAARGPAGVAGIRQAGVQRFTDPTQGPKLSFVDDELYVVADACSALASGSFTEGIAVAQTTAQNALDQHLAAQPGDRGRYQVIPSYLAA